MIKVLNASIKEARILADGVMLKFRMHNGQVEEIGIETEEPRLRLLPKSIAAARELANQKIAEKRAELSKLLMGGSA